MVVAFNVTGDEHGDWTVLRVSGELDLVSSPLLRQQVHEAVAEGRRQVVVDLSDVIFCDSSGVGVLIATRRLMRSCQGRLRLILPADGMDAGPGGAHVNRVINALGVRRLFDVQPDVKTAVTQGDLPGADSTGTGTPRTLSA
ncbi:STAS domain-containing protein [Streptomyces sp. NPDC004610]|uniref:STAS domain-containing protein n=1 Tax=unclassified Streptomyces TaxID=2593676 RepID=UPI0033A64888